LNMTSRGVGVISAMAAHRLGGRCLALSMLCCRKFRSPLGVCWLPQTCESGPHSHVDSATHGPFCYALYDRCIMNWEWCKRNTPFVSPEHFRPYHPSFSSLSPPSGVLLC
jgi:hypothetical protein